MEHRTLIEKWLAVFGNGVDPQMMEDHVTSDGNHLWHLFTWGNVSCLSGEEARRAFDALPYEKATRFSDGYAGHIDALSVVRKLSAGEVDADPDSDVYIVADDFSWTYVRTHEPGLGPYLCVKEPHHSH